MEEVYVVKVRSQPSPARLFPSERRYSASTVGGLGAVHLLLAATCLLLGALDFLAASNTVTWVTRYGGGLWLGLAAALPGAAGVLAWRRWYVDNNIRWFFVSSTVSGFASLLCLALTAAALAVSYESRDNYHQRTILPDHSVTTAPNPRRVEFPDQSLNPPSHPGYDLPQRQTKDPLAFETTRNIDQTSEEGVAFETFHTDVSTKLITSKDSNSSATDEIVEGKPTRQRRRAQSDSNDDLKLYKDVNVDDTSQERKSGEKVEFYLRPWSPFDTHTGEDSGEQGPFRGERKDTRTMVMINILVASTLELLWSIFSAKIAWKGMKNGYPDEVINHPDRQRKKNRPPLEGDAFPQTKKNKTEPMKDVNGKPDILFNHKRSSSKDKGGRKSDVIVERTVSGPNSVQVEGPRLPMEESTMEYQERVRRFLESNQKHSLTLSVRDM